MISRGTGTPEARQTRITLGAWSWAGLLATFDADSSNVEPAELREVCRTIARRYQQPNEASPPKQP